MFNSITIVICLFIFISRVNCGDRGNNLENPTKNCKQLLNEFSLAVANYTYCSINNARPVSLCEFCVKDYIEVLSTHKKLMKVKINGSPCIDYFVNLDRLQVVNSIYQSTEELWTRAQCDECFHFVNGSLTPQPSEVKINFNILYQNFSSCVEYMNGTNQTDMCDNCMASYIQLNNYYFNNGDVYKEKGTLCMDIVDLMNKTQAMWSKECCKYRRKSEYIYIATTVFMCFLPILFYVFSKLFIDIKKLTLLRQRRFAESVSTSIRTESQ